MGFAAAINEFGFVLEEGGEVMKTAHGVPIHSAIVELMSGVYDGDGNNNMVRKRDSEGGVIEVYAQAINHAELYDLVLAANPLSP